jgi:hypothetical protein
MTKARFLGRRLTSADGKNASKIVKGRLTHILRGFPARLRALTESAQLIIVRAMNGLNHICDICREIIG